MDWTNEQKDAIYKKNSNILVAAAAGSGKTAVLVERIIQKILKDKIDIDKLLVVTFTNAAASEMRERVLDAIYKKLDEEPDNEHLQKQLILLGKSNICTIHSFCLDVIKNNFFEINLSANFRIGTQEEIELLKQEVLEEVFEKYYELEDENFSKLIDTYTSYRGDENLKEIILNIYKFMQSSPFPNEWLTEKVDLFKKREDNDFSRSIWGEILLKNLKEELTDAINSLKIVENKIEKYVELEKYVTTIQSDIELLKRLSDSTNSWDDAFSFSNEMKFEKWPTDKKIVLDIKDEARDARSDIKTKIMKTVRKILPYDSQCAYQDIYAMYEILVILKEVILNFDKEFKEKKRERNIIDFNDIEHYALEILVKKDENGEYAPTEVAKKYKEKFEEIAIDEYQDSNQVQEYILSVVSRGNNLFMVGDVKQSIYKFRQACPELFLKKYKSYSLDGNDKGLKIQLFKNFRSRKNILDITNLSFSNIMSKDLGDINYTEEEYLNLGADYEEIEDGLDIAELDIIDLKEEDTETHYWNNEEDDDEAEEFVEDEETLEQLEKEEIEANFVAKRIEELVESKVKVKDKKMGYREITYKDIVILLRSTARTAPIFEKALLKRNIPVFSDSSNEYLDTIEIQTIINLLKILDNPIDDISLVSVLRSKIVDFTDNEILEIRLCNKTDSFYQSLLDAQEKLNNELGDKVKEFIKKLAEWKEESNYLSLAELIWKIYTDTGIYNYVGLMPNGALRQANLEMLFERAKEYEKTSFSGLFNFIKFIEKLRNGNSDLSSAKIIGENENVVRIMSIHKSKGLEFPVVFLSRASKNINLQDLNSNLLLHQKMGIGPQYINYEKMVEYSTSAKDAIKIIIKNETISEEMRVLYVALTRAKEKLIITGTSKDYQKELDKKKEILKIYKKSDNKINPILLKKYINYLDWIQLIYLNSNMEEFMNINVYNKNDLIENQKEVKEEFKEKFDFEKNIDFEKIKENFDFNYVKEILSKLPIKTTVSEIKEMQNEEVEEINLNEKREIGIEAITPKFLEKEEFITGSKKGTLMHLFLQKINFREDYNLEKLNKLKDELVIKKIITKEEAECINLNSIQEFLKSNLCKKIKECIKIEKEKAFCMKLSIKEIFDESERKEIWSNEELKNIENESILVQGIIDLYGITEKDEIILVDYKTDFVKQADELKQKYVKQLKLYKIALEKALNKKVSNIYIYSLYLDKEILI